jgi:hypothetical protein
MIEGRFNIAVEARQANKTGSSVISQSNTLASASTKSSKKKWIIIGIIVAGGAGAGMAFRSGGSSAQNSPAVLSVGTVVVGGPR